ncbi:diguanylate cyclase [Agaribacterium sp. ZY112]|uniref:diguanylate cyclase n=1 Tax=Agaribacterium sp. ZY112 TaxID=3233574 RepID=UPI0035253E33
MKAIFSALISLCFMFCSLHSQAAQTVDINIPKLANDRDKLVIELIELVLQTQNVKANFIESAEQVSDSRQAEELRSGRLSLLWAGMSQDREEELLPVRVPLFKGIQGHRIFCIRPDKQSYFSAVQNLDDLKRLEAGSGLGWGDTYIIEAAGIPTVTTAKGASLWLMLDGERFDYFPLAIHEPWSEIAARPELNLGVEKTIMLVYPFGMYIYVNKDNQQLHDLLYKGMNAAIDDGSYDKFLFSSPLFKDALIAADVSKRKVIRIPNPFIHPATPVNIEKYWLDPEKLTIEELRAL